MKKNASAVLFVLLVFLAFISMSGCGSDSTSLTTAVPNATAPEEETPPEDESNLEVTTDTEKSVELPADYPKDSFPVYEGAFISAVQSLDNSYIVVAFCKEPVSEVSAFYKDLFNGSQVISVTELENEYTVFGVKDNYTFTVSVLESADMEGYPTSLLLSLVPAP